MHTTANQLTQVQRRYSTYIAYFTGPLTGICIDIYTASLPHMAIDLHTTATLVQYTLSLYLLGYALCQIIIASISDIQGRRHLIITGTLANIVITTLIIMAHDIHYIIVYRFLQGIALATIAAPNRAILVDIYQGKTLKHKISLFAVIWSATIIFSPAIGSYLEQYYNWRACFYLILIYNIIICLLAVFVLKETLPHKEPINVKSITANYRIIFTDPLFLALTLCTALLYSNVPLFTIFSSYICQSRLNLSASQFGHITILSGTAWLMGSLIYQRKIKQRTPHLKSGFHLIIFISLSMIYIATHATLSLPVLLIPSLIALVILSYAYTNIWTTAITQHPEIGATSASFLSTTLWVITSLLINMNAIAHTYSVLTIALNYFLLSLLAYLLLSMTTYRQAKRIM